MVEIVVDSTHEDHQGENKPKCLNVDTFMLFTVLICTTHIFCVCV